MKEMFVDVTVAALWTSPSSPRTMDRTVLENPVRIKDWLKTMSYDDRLALCGDNLVQSQLLYGEKVLVTEENEFWAKVLVPSQPSSKDERGYPGWIPINQLSEWEPPNTDSYAVVTVPRTELCNEQREKLMELSFQTRLPVHETDGEWLEVYTPAGLRFIKNKDAAVIRSERELLTDSGDDVVKTGEQFLGLPYLWGGMSAFGYDCSGFAYNMLRAHGAEIPRDASDQSREGKAISKDSLRPGDLLFFAYEEGKGFVHHVGIYYGDGRMIHAPNTGKAVEVIPLSGSAYEPEFCGVRRYWGE
jgi:cell wall-associated NlpC family hydrolase